jgi:hypothetical protein
MTPHESRDHAFETDDWQLEQDLMRANARAAYFAARNAEVTMERADWLAAIAYITCFAAGVLAGWLL